MRAEDLLEAITEIDDNYIADAKQPAQKPLELRPVKRSPWKGIIAAAACLGVLGTAGVLIAANRDAIGQLLNPNGAASNTVTPPSGYPEMAAYQYTGDYTELTPKIEGGVIPNDVYDNFDDLLAASDLLVVGTFLDDPYQTQDPTIDPDHPTPSNYVYLSPSSLNRLRIDKVLYGDAQIGDEAVIFDHGGVMGPYLYGQKNGLTPMIKGESWIYFLREVNISGEDFYVPTVADTSSRYPVPGKENSFIHSDNNLGLYDASLFNYEIYDRVKALLNLGVEVIFDNYGLENPQWEYDKTFTMPEFPGQTFNWSSDMEPSLNVFLTDLNGDGYREICRTVLTYNNRKTIVVSDIANGTEIRLPDDEYDHYLTVTDVDVLTEWKCWHSDSESSCGEKISGEPLINLIARLENPEDPIDDPNPESPIDLPILDPVKNYIEMKDISKESDYINFFHYEYITPENEPVFSTVEGTVVGKGSSAVFIRSHSDGQCYTYLGLSNIEAELGDKVSKGQRLGIAYSYDGTSSIALLCTENVPAKNYNSHKIEVFGDGVMFMVEWDEKMGVSPSNLAKGEDIRLTATVKNNTNHDIYLISGYVQYTDHYIHADLKGDKSGAQLRDSTEPEVVDTAMDKKKIAPGESYVQELVFPTAGVPADRYFGTLNVGIGTDPNSYESERYELTTVVFVE